MRVFVTGGSGFIGSTLIRRLRLEGHEVRALVRSDRARGRIIEMDAIPVRGDITQPGSWQDEVCFGDVIIHGAAFVSDWGSRREFCRVNVNGTRNILAALGKWDGHFVHLSSIAVHGFRRGEYTEESKPIRCGHPYCTSKANAERLVSKAAGNGLKASLVRIAGVYGPDDPHFMTRILEQAGSGRVFVIGKGNQPSSLIYIDDVVEGLMRIIEGEWEPGEKFVLCHQNAPDVRAMVEYALEVLEQPVAIQSIPGWLARLAAAFEGIRACVTGSRPSITRYAVRAMGNRCVFSMRATADKLGWSPSMNVHEGIARTISWFRNNKDKDSQSDFSRCNASDRNSASSSG
ncbi:MAG: NAD(P)-dependent oxidoreductase [Candidatus Fermentibacteria bacterium]